MMDIERTVAERLAASTGIRAFLEVPGERPDEFLTVEMTGGSGDRFIRGASLAVQSWAKTRRRAAEVSRLVVAAVPGLVEEPNIFRAAANGSYRWPDPDSRQHRYQTNVEITICE